MLYIQREFFGPLTYEKPVSRSSTQLPSIPKVELSSTLTRPDQTQNECSKMFRRHCLHVKPDCDNCRQYLEYQLMLQSPALQKM